MLSTNGILRLSADRRAPLSRTTHDSSEAIHQVQGGVQARPDRRHDMPLRQAVRSQTRQRDTIDDRNHRNRSTSLGTTTQGSSVCDHVGRDFPIRTPGYGQAPTVPRLHHQ